jgi:pyrophosphatase PpaX
MNARPAVLFDLDGTLIDSITLIVESARHAFTKCDLPSPSEAEWLADLGLPLQTMFARFAAAERVEELIAGYREFQIERHDSLVSSYREIPEIVSALKAAGFLLGVVTSKSDRMAHRGLVHTRLEQYFDTIVGLDSCVRHKPDPEPVLVALRRLGVRADRAVFIGDSPYDIASGRGAGTLTAAALWGPFSREQLTASEPDYYLDRPSDILTLSQGWL